MHSELVRRADWGIKVRHQKAAPVGFAAAAFCISWQFADTCFTIHGAAQRKMYSIMVPAVCCFADRSFARIDAGKLIFLPHTLHAKGNKFLKIKGPLRK